MRSINDAIRDAGVGERRSMTGMKRGQSHHMICDWIIDHSNLLHRVSEMSFPHRPGRVMRTASGITRPWRRAQGVTAAFNGIVRQLRKVGRHPDVTM